MTTKDMQVLVTCEHQNIEMEHPGNTITIRGVKHMSVGENGCPKWIGQGAPCAWQFGFACGKAPCIDIHGVGHPDKGRRQ